MKVSIVIPCYNSSRSLPELMERICKLQSLYEVEVVCVNDCSKDNTINILEQLTESYSFLKVIDLVYNVGQFKALLCAMEHATGEVIVTIDDDLQHRPEEIPLLVEHLVRNNQLDVVIGAYKEKKHKVYRNLGTLLVATIDKRIFHKPDNLKTSSFRAMTSVFAKALVAHKTQFPVIGPLILSLTRKIENVEVNHEGRKYGKSGYSFSKLIAATFDNVFNFSSLPLKILSMFGFTISIVSLCIIVFTTIKYLLGGIGVPGWTSLIIFVNFYSGLILIGIGIIGEYLIRILKESNNSPRYQIRSKLNFKE